MATAEQIKVSVLHDGNHYATLDFCSPDDPHDYRFENLDELAAIGNWQRIPIGWQLAANSPPIIENIISKHSWGCDVLLVEDGYGYGTAAHPEPGSQVMANRLQVSSGGLEYRPDNSEISWIRILIFTPSGCLASSQPSTLGKDMWNAQLFTDCELCCGGQTFSCHRVVLSTTSPVFKRMLESEMKEGHEKRIDITDASPDVVQCMLEYLYTGVGALKQRSDLISMMVLADKYEVESLSIQAAEVLVGRFTDKDNISETAKCLYPYATRPGFKHVWETMCQKMSDMIKEDTEFLQAALLDILSGQTLPPSLSLDESLVDAP